MRVQKSPLQKIYEISTGSDSINVEFYGSNRQFDWLELLLVCDKSDKHLTIYGSYSVELAAKLIKSLALGNFTEAYSLTNEKNMAFPIPRKNIFYLNNLLLGAVTDAA